MICFKLMQNLQVSVMIIYLTSVINSKFLLYITIFEKYFIIIIIIFTNIIVTIIIIIIISIVIIQFIMRWSSLSTLIHFYIFSIILLGRDYTDYNGNPHQFGSSHPRYVNYSSLSSKENNSDDNFLLELSQQSQINDHMLRLEKNNLLTTSLIENDNNNEFKSKNNNKKGKTTAKGLENFLDTNFALPKSAFTFDHVQAVINLNHTRENSFDETKTSVKGSINQNYDNNNDNSNSDCVVANVKYITLTFKFDKERIMEIVDQILNK